MSVFVRKSLPHLLEEAKESGAHSLKRTLGPFQLTALGVGAVIGAGIFVLAGFGAHYAGPGLMLSFVLSGLGCAFAALCYAEFAAMIPLACSAYTYAYATLGEIFPASVKAMNPAWKTVTVAQLLEHRAGVPTEGSRLWTLLRLHFAKGSVEEKRQQIVAKILARAPKYPPGTKYLYTALDYVIVGAMLEKVTGRSWEELIQERLWQPLDITSGGFGAPGTKQKQDEPCGHWGALFDGCPVVPAGFWSRLSMPLFIGPGGAAHMTITDWSKFVGLHLRGDPANPHRQASLLKPDSFATLHEAAAGQAYQAGWYLGVRPWAKGTRPGDVGRVLASQGDNGFWHAEAWVAPERDFAVLIVCNQGGTGNKPAARVCNDALGALIRDYLPKN